MEYPKGYINQIVCGDWFKTIKMIPDNSIGGIITDPPYGINVAEWDKNIDFLELIEEMHTQFIRVLKEKRLAFIWIPKKKLYELHKLNFDFEVFIETKNFAQMRIKDILIDAWVPILMFRKGEEKIETRGGRNWYMVNSANTSKRNRDNPRNIPHPTVKDVSIVKYFIGISSFKNDIILDPFLGSGTTAVACRELERRYIGIEINPEYCKIAAERLKEIQLEMI